MIILPLLPAPIDSAAPSPARPSRRQTPTFIFFFHRRLQSVHDDPLRSRRPSSFFHPLNHPASTLSSRALNVSTRLSPRSPTLLRPSFLPPCLLVRAQTRRRLLLSSLSPRPFSTFLNALSPFLPPFPLAPSSSDDLSQSRSGILA